MTTVEQLQQHLATGIQRITADFSYKTQAKHVICADGTKMSVQASESHYSLPRDNVGPYTHVEVWCYSGKEVTEFKYEDDNPSGYVPIEAVAALIDRHGGFAKE